MSKHTPGPWTVHRAKRVGDVAIICEGRHILAECYEDIRRHDERCVAECEANARLIAAAPDLLEALRRMVNMSSSREVMKTVENCRELVDAHQAAQAAIVKAEGA